MQEYLFRILKERLQSLSELKWIDWNKGQAEFPQKYPPMPLPALLLSIDSLKWQDRLEGAQEGNLVLHVDVYRKAQENAQNPDNAFLQLLTQIVGKLQHFSTPYLHKLTRIEEKTLPFQHQRWGYRQTYASPITDYQHVRTTTTHTVRRIRTNITAFSIHD